MVLCVPGCHCLIGRKPALCAASCNVCSLSQV
jgi:hypothetical protein